MDVADRLRALAPKIRPQALNNSFAMSESVKEVIALCQAVSVEDFIAIRTGLNDTGKADDDYSDLTDRMRSLHHRMEQDGQYTDANIVWRALEKLSAA